MVSCRSFTIVLRRKANHPASDTDVFFESHWDRWNSSPKLTPKCEICAKAVDIEVSFGSSLETSTRS